MVIYLNTYDHDSRFLTLRLKKWRDKSEFSSEFMGTSNKKHFPLEKNINNKKLTNSKIYK